MSIFKHNLSKKTKRNIVIGLIIIALLAAYIVFDIATNGPLTRLLSEKDQIIDFVQRLGIFGPLAFIFLQVLQIIIAPLPGQVTGIAGGVLFGWWGILWTTISTFLGYWLLFWLSRKFGRSLAEKLIKKSSLDKFDNLTSGRRSIIFFLLFLIPGLPDDVIGYVAGLTDIPIRKLLTMVIIGRMPAIVAANMIGAGINSDSTTMVVVTSLISVIVIAFVFINSDRIFAWLNKEDKTDK